MLLAYEEAGTQVMTDRLGWRGSLTVEVGVQLLLSFLVGWVVVDSVHCIGYLCRFVCVLLCRGEELCNLY